MKITAILLLAACLQVTAHGYSQGKITLSEKDASLKKVLNEIKKQTGYQYFFVDQWEQEAKKVNIEVINATLEEVLGICFKDQPFSYAIVKKTIVIKQKDPIPTKSELPVAQIDVRGRVVDENGKPVNGVTVTIKGTKTATSTNENGEFSFKTIDKKSTLIFTSVNMESFEVDVDGRGDLMVNLKTKVSGLDEVQVIAYGTTTQRLSTGNVSTVKAEDIEKQPVSNPLLALEGRVPGLVISQSTGVPGGGIKVRVQGQNSLNSGNDPLFVIDGVPYISQLLPDLTGGPGGILGDNGNTSPNAVGTGNPLSFINPADIESIDILKDADATSIYGSRAAAGAILITTKKGKAGRTKVDVNMQTGWGKINHMLDLLNTNQYLEMRHEAKINDGAPIRTTDYDINGTWDTTRYTDWQKVLLGGTARYTNAQVSASGGNVNTHFLMGMGYHKETTVFPGDLSDQKGSFHFSINHISENQKFRVQLSGNYMADNNQIINTDLTNTAIQLAPNAPALHNGDGTLNWAQLSNGNSSWYNPLAYLSGNYNKKTNNLIGNALISYQILPGFDIKSSVGYTSLQTNEISIFPLLFSAPENRPYTDRIALYGNNSINSWIIEPQIAYKRGMGRGMLETFVGATFLQNNSNSQQLYGVGYNSDAVIKDINSAATVGMYDATINSIYKYNALFGRINYNWQNKFIVNFTARKDGSSRFGSKNLFHNFGAVGAAWIFSNESFIQKKLPFVSFGKLRTSYGTTGNDQIGDYKFMNLYKPVGVPVTFQGATGLAPIGLPNPYLQWEETKKLQIGLDLGFFKERALININYYYNRSSNQLQPYALPLITGNNNIQLNFPATIQNTGWELSLNTTNIKQNGFAWSSTINLTLPKNKLVAYPRLESSSYANFYLIGQPIPISKSFHYLGVDPTTGLFTVADKNGKISASPSYPDDAGILNVGTPTLYGGFQNNFRYKGFELDLLFQFVKQKAANYKLGDQPGGFYSNNSGIIQANQPVSVLDRWQKTGDASTFQRFSSVYPADISNAYNNANQSDLTFSDASYIRLKNLSLSWQLPEKWRQSAHLQNARVYILGQNLLTITKYIGLDPETKSTINLPSLRIWTFGVQITL